MLTKNTNQLKQRVAEHVATDSVVQGISWDTENLRGCFIGCLAHSDDPIINAETYGLPVELQRIAENIFVALPAKEAKTFFAALPDAVKCDGKDLSKVHWQFLAAELRRLPQQPDAIQTVIDPVIAGMDLLAAGLDWPAARAAAARAAAWAAADAAWAAAAAAADAAGAAGAARAAAAAAADAAAAGAADAARAAGAARAAAAGAADAARAAARFRQRDLLLRLIANAPVMEQLDD